MNKKSDYQRLFFILQRGEVSPSNSPQPTGYLRILKNGDNIKIFVNAVNLPNCNKASYDLVIIFEENSEYSFPAYKSYKLNSNSNGISQDVNISKLSIDDFDFDEVWGFAICETVKDVNGYAIRNFPLISIKNEDRPWRQLLLDKINGIDKKEVVSTTKEYVAAAEWHEEEKEEKEEEPIEEDQVDEVIPEPSQTKDEDKYLDEYFEKYDPFGTTNPSYRWWKCHDMHKLNEVLIKIDVWLPFELNKEGYIACEEFNHVVLGLYDDGKTSRKFVVIGIPAENKQGKGNYHNNSRWETTAIDFNPDGYWLTFIDYETSNVVRAT